jgi:hypothetical protein
VAGLGRIINPVTARGTIVAADRGAPVVASTHPEWAAEFMLANPAPMPYPLFHLASYVLPEKTQAFYDALLDPLFRLAIGRHSALAAVMPHPLVAGLALTADLLAAALFIPFTAPALLLALGGASYWLRSRK